MSSSAAEVRSLVNEVVAQFDNAVKITSTQVSTEKNIAKAAGKYLYDSRGAAFGAGAAAILGGFWIPLVIGVAVQIVPNIITDLYTRADKEEKAAKDAFESLRQNYELMSHTLLATDKYRENIINLAQSQPEEYKKVLAKLAMITEAHLSDKGDEINKKQADINAHENSSEKHDKAYNDALVNMRNSFQILLKERIAIQILLIAKRVFNDAETIAAQKDTIREKDEKINNLEAARVANEKTINGMKETHNKAINGLKAAKVAHEREIKDLKAAHEKAINDLKTVKDGEKTQEKIEMQQLRESNKKLQEENKHLTEENKSLKKAEEILNKAIKEKDQAIEEKNQALKEKEETIKGLRESERKLNEALAANTTYIAQLESRNITLNSLVNGGEGRIRSLERKLNEARPAKK